MSQIRLQKTPQIEEALRFLKSRYHVLSEAEIIKVALAEKYTKELGEIPLVDVETEKLIAKGMEEYKSGQYTLIATDEELHDYLKNL